MYLDDAPLTYSGGIADLHNYDIERIEVLNGPQGTYYGASATSGTVRIITKKPDPDAVVGGVDVSYGGIEGADGISTLEGFVNIPVQDGVSALRLVAWYDKSDGFIDNVSTSRTYMNGATASNSSLPKKHTTKRNNGFRGAFKTSLGDQWSATVSGFMQESTTKGAWDHDPTRYEDLEVARFGPEYGELTYGQVAWNVEGDLGFADIIYSGSFLDRSTETTSDYSDYVEYASFGAWVQQFACDDYYWYGNVAATTPACSSRDYESEQTTHEIRINPTGDGLLTRIAGAYFEDNSSDNFIFWDMPGIQHDGGPGAYYTASWWRSVANEWYADWEPEWQQTAFGEVSYDVTDRLTATVGARMFESEFLTRWWMGRYFYNPKARICQHSGST